MITKGKEFIFFARNLKIVLFYWGERWQQKVSIIFFGTKIKNNSMREVKRAKQMWIILFFNISPRLRVLFLFWLQKYNPHFWLSTTTSLKSTFIFFILVPFCCHLSPSSGILIFFISVKSNVFYFGSKNIWSSLFVTITSV